MYEYIPYEPENNKAEVIQTEPEATELNNEIDNALSIMHDAQIKNNATEPVKEPEATEPEATEPEATEPVKEPEATEPVKEPEATEPEATEPVKEPEATEPEPEPGYINFRHTSTFFKRVFKIISTVNNEAKIFFSSDKIKTTIVDPAHVLMCTFEIPSFSIEEYKIVKDVTLGFDIDKLNYILKNSGKNDMLQFLYDTDKDTGKAFIKNGLFNHTYALIDSVPLPEPKIPTLDLPVTIKLNTKLLHDFLVQADKISDHIEITANKDSLTFNATGDSDKVEITLNKDQISYYQCNNSYKSLFSVDYLLSIIKPVKTLFDEITINMGSDNPIRIIGDNGYKIEILMAPRIESE